MRVYRDNSNQEHYSVKFLVQIIECTVSNLVNNWHYSPWREMTKKTIGCAKKYQKKNFKSIN